MHVASGHEEICGIDTGLADPNEQQPPDTHQLDNGQHHRDLRQAALCGNGGGEKDADQTVNKKGEDIEW
ncbi:hypothetical protein D9M73_250600 [compost metagenome]